ncbi:helix-turn-helix transcriptional regulator [Paractinoplanes hotanensis]|uniref:Helix-turn-helix domain-containing protein n=1 Tax=Paractinoplanes hotanensis TaxID=2906497 RepID=A0ABT0YF45_9ACTN|nr:helix-turn-helix domain-containing protein [Actinoplanes hotanensis]MCM4084673.1 helix-turn-helix domain-containing protein [Actinoplanes hotanensis]
METPRIGPTGETIDTPRHRALGSSSRVTILRLVRAAESGVTAAEVAARTGQHLSTTRAHLDRLAEAGLLVKARASGGQPGRPAWRYRAASADPAPAPYRALAAALLEHLSGGGGDVREAAARAGQGWGRHLAAVNPDHDDPVDAVLTVSDGLGFSPRREPPDSGDGVQVNLYTCPFLELVDQNPDAMCGLHLGVVRGILDRAGVPGESVVLEPFGAPAACVVRLPAPVRPAGERS